MAFKHTAADLKSRYNEHQSHAKARVASIGKGPGWNVPVVSQGKAIQTDVRNTHDALPKQVTGVNKTQTIQKDINTGTVGAKVPNQQAGSSMNTKTLQSDLHGSRGGVHKPGAR